MPARRSVGTGIDDADPAESAAFSREFGDDPVALMRALRWTGSEKDAATDVARERLGAVRSRAEAALGRPTTWEDPGLTERHLFTWGDAGCLLGALALVAVLVVGVVTTGRWLWGLLGPAGACWGPRVPGPAPDDIRAVARSTLQNRLGTTPPPGARMSFQAYLDAVEKKTGLTPRQLIDLAHERGFDASTKAAPILAWLAEEHGLGRGHGMAMVHVITKGPQIATTHVGGTGSHRDASDTLWLDGSATRPR